MQTSCEKPKIENRLVGGVKTPDVFSIIRFSDKAESESARWCYEHNITGCIVGWTNNRYKITAGLGYYIYAAEHEIEIVANRSDVPPPYDF